MWDFIFNKVLYWTLRIVLRSLSGAGAGLYTFWILLTIPDRHGGDLYAVGTCPPEYYWVSAGIAALVVIFPAQIMEFISAALPKDRTSSMTVQKHRPLDIPSGAIRPIRPSVPGRGSRA